MSKLNYKYDVVLSFSKAQKDIAVGIQQALDNINIATYYYPYHIEENLGVKLKDNLRKLYKDSGRLALAVLSNEYFIDGFTTIELKAILQRLEKQSDYFIPIALKGTKLPENVAEFTYIEWNSDPVAIAKIVAKRLQDITTKKIEKKADVKTNHKPIYVIVIDRRKHESFLADHRTDPVNKELIRVGDQVVVCKVCKTVFHKDVWEEVLYKSHCEQSETLKELPNVNSAFGIKDNITTYLRTINKLAPFFSFGICDSDTEVKFNKVVFTKKKSAKATIHYKRYPFSEIKVKLKFSNLVYCKKNLSAGVIILLFKSEIIAKGIMLNTKPLKEIAIYLLPKEEESHLINEFYEVLLKINTNNRDKEH